jgi:hypothetical protein
MKVQPAPVVKPVNESEMPKTQESGLTKPNFQAAPIVVEPEKDAAAGDSTADETGN